jgi:hypothetical protein
MDRLPLIAVIAAAAALAGCDSHARLSPDFLKLSPPPVAEAEAAPDARQVVRDNLTTIFATQAAPKNVAVSRPAMGRYGWTACVRAAVSSITGTPVGVQTFLVGIERGKIGMRQRVDQTHACANETYEPV